MKYLASLLLLSLLISCQSPEKKAEEEPRISESSQLDSIIGKHNFSGVVLFTKGDKILYNKAFGYSNIELTIPMHVNDQFVIGSISKQITAVMVLRAYEQGRLKLDATLDTYLDDLTQSWAKKVTIHQLLTHTHGIVEMDQALEFEPGSQFSYSQIGFELLGNILEEIYDTNFERISTDFFKEIGLNNTFHPDNKSYQHLVIGYEENEFGKLISTENVDKPYIAAGGFISTAADLNAWNQLLHGGKLLKEETFELMKKRHATRVHPMFGEIEYGYGLLFKKGEINQQIGATGYAAGYASACYFYPEKGINLIILENTAYDLDDFNKTFRTHLELMEFVKRIH